MNPYDLIVEKILNFYSENFSSYPIIPNNHEECTTECVFIGPGSYKTGVADYRTSITVDSSVISSKNGEVIQLKNVFDNHLKDIMNLYWINESQGYQNARIIAHIFTFNSYNNSIVALVKKP